MDTIYKFKGSVNSDLDIVKNFLENTLENLNKFIYDEELLFEIKLILNELVVNSVLHGNDKDLNKRVYLNLTLNKNYIVIVVRDEGKGISYNKDMYNYKDLNSYGRGLVLVDALTDSLILNENEVIVIKNVY